MQTSYAFDMDRAFVGMKADSRFDHVASFQGFESIPIGRGVAKVVGSDQEVRLPRKNGATITFDADLITANVIDGDFNGVAIASVTFSGTHDATMILVAAAFEALTGCKTAVVSAARVITIVADEGLDAIVENVVVTLGSTQAGAVVALSSNDGFYGVGLHTHRLEQDSAGVVAYPQYDAVNTLRQGAVYVFVEEAATSDDPVFWRIFGDGSTTFTGNFRKSADGVNTIDISSIAKFLTSTTAAGIIEIEFNLP